MKDLIACCGLDCKACEARLAAIRDDNGLRRKVAEDWPKLNGVEITPAIINCAGCRVDGVKTPYCASLCPIRQSARGRGAAACGDCVELESCEKVGMILDHNADARRNLIT